jgi:membrane protease YdiL (CAAX protease family)
MAATQVLSPNVGKRPIGIILLGGYVALYAVMLFAMQRSENFDVSEPLLVFAILGVGFSLATWQLTLRVSPLDYPIANPEKELATVAAWLVPVVAFITWGLGLLHRYVPSDPADAFVILAAKLIVFVIVPAILMRARFGYRVRQLAPMSVRASHVLVGLGMCFLMLAFQSVLGRGLQDIRNAHLPGAMLAYGVPLTFVWLALEAGVVEEFFFRVLLQTRLSAVLKSDLGAIVIMSLLFGLAHAPGLYLRASLTQEGLQHPSVLMAVGYSIVITSVAGFFLGLLWARTRNFAVVVVVHAMCDLLPNVLPTLRSLHLLHLAPLQS